MEYNQPNKCAKIPDLVLSKVFGYLSVEDLVNVKCVSEDWLLAANDPDIWKHVTLKIKYEDSDQSVVNTLRHLPLLKHITSKQCNCGSETFVQGLVKYVKCLKTFDVSFDLYLSAKHVKWIAKKFPKLEVINLNYHALDLIASLDALKRCKHLKYVHFNFSLLPWYIHMRRPLQGPFGARIASVLSQLSIDKLDIASFQDYYIADYDLIKLLNQKADILVSLNAVCCKQDIFNAILGCTKLQELTLIVKFVPASFSLTSLRSLKCLTIYQESPEEEIVRVMFPSSLEKLVWNCLYSGDKESVIFADNIVSGLQNLKHLHVSVCFDSDINRSLNTITRLPRLETLVLCDAEHLTDEGIRHISKCQQLRNLVLEDIPITNESLNLISKCSKLQSLTLGECDFDSDNLYKTLTELKYLSEVKLLDSLVVRIVLSNLRKAGIYINILVY